MLFNLNINTEDLIDINLFPKKTYNDSDKFFSDNSTNSSVFIVHQNIRSIRENFDSLLAHLNTSSILPDFIFLSEIWIYKNEVNDYTIPGYKEFCAATNESSVSGGVGVFVKECYDFQIFIS